MNAQGLAVLAAAALALGAAVLTARNRSRLGRALAAAALAALAAVIAYRWARTSHPPVFGTFESDLADGAALLVAGLVLSRRAARSVAAGAIALGGALPVRGLAHGVELFPLTISERSWWIDVHAPAGYAAFALLVVGGLESARLWAQRDSGTEEPGLLSWCLLWGFLLLSAVMVTGMYYSSILFGHLWRWDPVESLALAAWLAFGTLVHARLFFGWSERRVAPWAAGATILALLLFKGLVYLPGAPSYHVFDVRL